MISISVLSLFSCRRNWKTTHGNDEDSLGRIPVLSENGFKKVVINLQKNRSWLLLSTILLDFVFWGVKGINIENPLHPHTPEYRFWGFDNLEQTFMAPNAGILQTCVVPWFFTLALPWGWHLRFRVKCGKKKHWHSHSCSLQVQSLWWFSAFIYFVPFNKS